MPLALRRLLKLFSTLTTVLSYTLILLHLNVSNCIDAVSTAECPDRHKKL